MYRQFFYSADVLHFALHWNLIKCELCTKKGYIFLYVSSSHEPLSVSKKTVLCACDGSWVCQILDAHLHVWVCDSLTPSRYSFCDSRHIIYPHRHTACIIQDLIKPVICVHCHRDFTHSVCLTLWLWLPWRALKHVAWMEGVHTVDKTMLAQHWVFISCLGTILILLLRDYTLLTHHGLYSKLEIVFVFS